MLAAEHGSGPKVPAVLVNGNLHLDGDAPPYSPSRVGATLMAVADDGRITDAEIVERIGPPAAPTGSAVACNHVALAAGEITEMVETARIAVETGSRGPQIALSRLPLGIGGGTICASLASRVRARRRGLAEFGELGLPLRDVRDTTHGDTTRVVCEPNPGADIDELVEQIAATWGVRTRRSVQLARPLPQLVRALVDDDTDAQRSAVQRFLNA